jgi:hypothetical protein
MMALLEDQLMPSIEVDGFYTLCLRDAIRPMHPNAPTLSQAAVDLVRAARARGMPQSTLIGELEEASRAVEWVTPYEVEVHSRAFWLGRVAIESAYDAPAGQHAEAQRRESTRERPRSY